jgi:hypothetical protein
MEADESAIQPVQLNNTNLIIKHLNTEIIQNILHIIFVRILSECPELRTKCSWENPISRQAIVFSLTKVTISIVALHHYINHTVLVCSSSHGFSNIGLVILTPWLLNPATVFLMRRISVRFQNFGPLSMSSSNMRLARN